jgi:aminoglycoside phosphotransferase (APT) family kinase protein
LPAERLLASGRDCDVFDIGDGLVLRRAKTGRSLENEARVMRWVGEQGYPVPRVDRAEGPDLVMERVDGPTMVRDLRAHPWRARSHARVLAGLHARLHELAAPEWLQPAEVPGDAVIHRDFHPLNVILSPGGPVVIDWPNAARGSPAADVAQSWIIMATSEVDEPLPVRLLVGLLRRRLVGAYLRPFDLDEVREVLAPVAEARKADRNVRDGERRRIDELVARFRAA